MKWTRSQVNVVLAAYLGWTLDAFDFFLMVFLFTDVGKTFDAPRSAVVFAVTLTLIARPFGAFLFGRIAERFGRKPTLMWNILAYSALEVLSGFAPTLTSFLIVRFLFGIAMGGEWGIGSSLTMESIPARSRGPVSGLLQAGYPSGFFLASLANGLLHDAIGWRFMFVLGVIPALLVFFVRLGVDESPAWLEQRVEKGRLGLVAVLRRDWKLAIYAIVLMTAFNFFSHGSQDVYPDYFLKVQHGFDTHLSSLITGIGNIGAILGGLGFGWASERIGRRRAILIAALIALPVIPFWAFGTTPFILGLGAFLMQISVQGAWGVVPAHLNELSPAEIRATFPGTVYQLGNLIASFNGNIQVAIAEQHDKNFGLAMAIVVGTVSVVIALLVAWGPEHRGIAMSRAQRDARDPGDARDRAAAPGAATA